MSHDPSKPAESNDTHSVPAAKARTATPALRDKFLAALDIDDRSTLQGLTAYLVGCSNPLPSSTCERLGLKPGSTYGEGALALEQVWATQPRST